MARAATTSDAFNAIAEPQRRLIIDVLTRGEQPVNAIVAALDMKQPLVSKHLRVLREVGLVDVRTDGRQRIYSLNAEALRPVYDWISPYERMWSERYDRLEKLIEQAKSESRTNQT